MQKPANQGNRHIARRVQVPAHWLVPDSHSHVEKYVRTIFKVLDTPKGQKVGVLPPTSPPADSNHADEEGRVVKRLTSGKPFSRIIE